jgi:hypothetical protein
VIFGKNIRRNNLNFNWNLFLFENSITQIDLAKKTGYTARQINLLVKEKRITIRVKQAIEKNLGICLNKYRIKDGINEKNN